MTQNMNDMQKKYVKNSCKYYRIMIKCERNTQTEVNVWKVNLKF